MPKHHHDGRCSAPRPSSHPTSSCKFYIDTIIKYVTKSDPIILCCPYKKGLGLIPRSRCFWQRRIDLKPMHPSYVSFCRLLQLNPRLGDTGPTLDASILTLRGPCSLNSPMMPLCCQLSKAQSYVSCRKQ